MKIDSEMPSKTNLLRKSVRGIKSLILLYKRRQKLLPEKSAIIRSLACSSTRQEHTYNSWDYDQDYADQPHNNMKKEITSTVGAASIDASSCNNGTFMKQETKLRVDKEMMELELCEIENVVDMEEALHYYSCLRSPVYLGIVNKFLIDISSEFDQESSPSIITNSSKAKRTFNSTRFTVE